MESYASRFIPHRAIDVWSVVRDFDRWFDWHPQILAGSMESGAHPREVGAIRVQELAQGGVARARLTAMDDRAMRLVYEMLDGPYDVEDYFSTIVVRPETATGGAFVEWFGEYRADSSRESALETAFGTLVYAAGLQALASLFSHTEESPRGERVRR